MAQSPTSALSNWIECKNFKRHKKVFQSTRRCGQRKIGDAFKYKNVYVLRLLVFMKYGRFIFSVYASVSSLHKRFISEYISSVSSSTRRSFLLSAMHPFVDRDPIRSGLCPPLLHPPRLATRNSSPFGCSHVHISVVWQLSAALSPPPQPPGTRSTKPKLKAAT